MSGMHYSKVKVVSELNKIKERLKPAKQSDYNSLIIYHGNIFYDTNYVIFIINTIFKNVTGSIQIDYFLGDELIKYINRFSNDVKIYCRNNNLIFKDSDDRMISLHMMPIDSLDEEDLPLEYLSLKNKYWSICPNRLIEGIITCGKYAHRDMYIIDDKIYAFSVENRSTGVRYFLDKKLEYPVAIANKEPSILKGFKDLMPIWLGYYKNKIIMDFADSTIVHDVNEINYNENISLINLIKYSYKYYRIYFPEDFIKTVKGLSKRSWVDILIYSNKIILYDSEKEDIKVIFEANNDLNNIQLQFRSKDLAATIKKDSLCGVFFVYDEDLKQNRHYLYIKNKNTEYFIHG